MTKAHTDPLLDEIKGAMVAEAAAITRFAESAATPLRQAVEMIAHSKVPLVVAGIGKSGHIGRKIASTFCSVGKPAIFLHAAEASHGDLGLIQPGSVVLVLSNTGETTELSDLLHFVGQTDARLIALTGRADSTLARAAELVISYGTVREVCPNGLAPTTSTTLSLAIGDALAVGVTRLLGTLPEDFRRFHPGGKLGARLLKVADLMRSGEALPLIRPDLPMTEALLAMSEKALGCAILMADDRVAGIVTDGDLRRHITRLTEVTAEEIATPNPRQIGPEGLAAEAVSLMNALKITNLLVVDGDDRLIGILHIHDCLRAGVTA